MTDQEDDFERDVVSTRYTRAAVDRAILNADIIVIIHINKGFVNIADPI